MTSALKWLEISSRNNLGVFFSFCFPLPILRNPNAFLISPGEAMGYSHHQGLHLVHCLAWFSEQSSEVQTAIFIVPVLWLQKLGLGDIKRFLVCFPVSGQAVVNDWEAAPSADGACLLLATSPGSTQQGADPCPRSEQTAEHPQAPRLRGSDLGLLPHFLVHQRGTHKMCQWLCQFNSGVSGWGGDFLWAQWLKSWKEEKLPGSSRWVRDTIRFQCWFLLLSPEGGNQHILIFSTSEPYLTGRDSAWCQRWKVNTNLTASSLSKMTRL